MNKMNSEFEHITQVHRIIRNTRSGQFGLMTTLNSLFHCIESGISNQLGYKQCMDWEERNIFTVKGAAQYAVGSKP